MARVLADAELDEIQDHAITGEDTLAANLLYSLREARRERDEARSAQDRAELKAKQYYSVLESACPGCAEDTEAFNRVFYTKHAENIALKITRDQLLRERDEARAALREAMNNLGHLAMYTCRQAWHDDPDGMEAIVEMCERARRALGEA
jgi:hypothetical protein